MSEVVIIQTRRGQDGKDYPVQMPPPLEWRYAAIVLTHQLCHEQGLSQRAAQRELLARGYRRSLGTICYDLTRPMCLRCRPGG